MKKDTKAQAQEEAEQKAHEEAMAREKQIQEEAECIVREEGERVVQREHHQWEKLDLFLNELMMVEEFERDSEAEVERSEVTGEGGAEEVTGTQMSKMEVDDREDEMVVEKSNVSGGRKQACASTAVALKSVTMDKVQSNVSAAIACDQCCHHNIKCVLTDGGGRCMNCKAKHYRCSLVLAKEGSEGKGISLGMHCMMTTAGPDKGTGKEGGC